MLAVLFRLYQYSQSSLYEISLIGTFKMKGIPFAWLVIRTRTRLSENLG
jgi:hypothetical protein